MTKTSSKSRRAPEARCEACFMRRELCLCEEIRALRPSVANVSTQLFILMHYRERKLTTNTSRLAALALPHCEIKIRGLRDQPIDSAPFFSADRETLFLYPAETAVDLSEEFVATLKKPVNLIVPDGSWRQASKVIHREAFLKEVRCVKLPVAAPSGYLLRRTQREGGLATFEAIVRALGFLEGPERGPRVQKILEELFQTMVARTMRSRLGQLER